MQILHISSVSPSNYAFKQLSLENPEKVLSNKRFKTHEKFRWTLCRLIFINAKRFFFKICYKIAGFHAVS